MKQELSSRMRVVALISLAAFTLPFTSCGDDSGAESVFLYVINGYAGSNGLTIIGPTGTVTSTLAFGDREGPVEVNRSLGTEFTILLDGTPQAIELTVDLFAMYPQETGTLFLKRRADDADVDFTLFRHLQTISTGCSIVFDNGLSLSGNFLAMNEFAFAPQFRLEDPSLHGYLDETQQQVPTECGPLPIPAPAPIPRDFSDQIADPYYYLAACEDGDPGEKCAIWGSLRGDATVVGRRNTLDYIRCIADAITIKQPEVDPPLPFPPADAQAQCPTDGLDWDDVQIDLVAIQECKEDVTRSTNLHVPGETGTNVEQVLYLPESYCTPTFRIRSPGLETIFGPRSGDTLGSHQNGEIIESTVEIPRGSQHFYLLFGRPVNPLIWQWDSGGSFVDLARYPYFNDQNARIGDTDYPQ